MEEAITPCFEIALVVRCGTKFSFTYKGKPVDVRWRLQV